VRVFRKLRKVITVNQSHLFSNKWGRSITGGY